MKQYIFFIITLLFCGLNSWGQIDTNEIVTPRFNCPDQPKNGTWYCNYSNGELNHEYNFKNGKMDGVQKSFYPNGQLKSESHYRIGRKNGSYTSWDELGQKVSVSNWINGSKEGEQVFWYATGELKRKEYYEASKKTGIWLEWHKNGQLQSKRRYDGWSIIEDFGYWNSRGKEITNDIDRLIDAENLWSDSVKKRYENFNSQSKLLVKELIGQNKIDATQSSYFHKIISERKPWLKERMEALNYEYLMLTEILNIADSTVSTYEEFCFPFAEDEKIKKGFVFVNNQNIRSFHGDDWEAYISSNWNYQEFEKIPPENYSYPMGCIFPASRKAKKEFREYKEKIEGEGEVIEPYYKIMTLINGRTGEILISIQVPKKGKRKVEQRYGPF